MKAVVPKDTSPHPNSSNILNPTPPQAQLPPPHFSTQPIPHQQNPLSLQGYRSNPPRRTLSPSKGIGLSRLNPTINPHTKHLTQATHAHTLITSLKKVTQNDLSPTPILEMLPANVTLTINGNTLHFTFDIPQGDQGPQGPSGGPSGPEGPQGPPGEVTLQQLEDASATTANNPIAISPLYLPISDPPTQGEAILAHLNDLITTLTR